ncbi:hypothetical protein [Gorillibacterium sp. sgz5001074]|uniref:hypothetical protein n=1 Tax=Gorillibacterium sp. sgz5001074 TaxID=3446695 RepID=UPI003F66B64B
MSFKAIDMSLAVHKTNDAAQLQRDLHHKPQSDQSALAQSGIKTDEINRQKAPKLEETDKSKIRDNRKGKRQDKSGTSASHAEQASPENGPEAKKPPEPLHPYKGRHIDMSL